MNPTAIFSKSGKGVQEASGKTSSLSRPDRAVLSAIDGRANLQEVASKVGKQFDGDFKQLITKLDRDGFIREVSPGAASSGPMSKQGAAAPAKPASKPTAPMDIGSDLDFTSAMAAQPKKGPAAPPPQAVARAPAPPPKPINVPPPPPPPSAAEVAQKAAIAKDQQNAFARAREEAEAKAAEQRDRLKAEAEAKVRAETEAKLRDEADKKFKAEAEAAAKRAEAEAAAARSAAVRAAAEAKVKAEAEAKRVKEEAERVRQEAERAKREAEEKAERARQEAERARQEAEAKAERARKEAEEKARREQEELKRKLEEERRAREEAERKAKEEAERARRELEEERRKMEAERKQREEQARREDEERAARREREQQEEQERRAQRDAEEERERAEKAAASKREDEELSFAKMMEAQSAPPPLEPVAPPPPPKKKDAATGDAFADSLLADLDSFTQRDDEERKAKEEVTRKEKEEAARRKQEETDRQAREAAEARQREDDERRRKEEEKQRLREAEEARVRKVKEEQEQAEREAEERRKKVAAVSPAAGGDDIGISDSDLNMDEVSKEAALLEKKKDRKAEREKEREKEKAQKRAREAEAKSKKEKEREEKESKKAAAYRPRRKSHLGRNLFLSLIVLAVAGVGVAHVVPLSTADYERAATEALGRPVKIAEARFTLIGGPQFKFDGVSIGDFKVPTVRGYPELGTILSDSKTWTRIELDGLTLPQDALGEVLFAKGAGDSLKVPQITLKNLKLAGALPLPPLDGDVQLAGGGIRTATLRGPEGLVAKLGTKEHGALEFDVSTSQFTLPFAQGITLIQFSMKGDANRAGMKISQWDGLLFSGKVTGTANLRWGNTWNVDGVMTARGVNAAVFAPALVSDGRADGTGRFSMTGVEPAKLSNGARLEGNFTVLKGVLGSVDLSRALQTGGRVVTGQTQFAEMSGQGVYDRGAISLRNLNLGAGALNAGASADISERGELSGRIVADVRTSTQNLRSTLILGGTVQEPQVKN